MIIENQTDVTQAVEQAVSRIEDERLREILLALVRHLHGFVRELRLTEREFGQAVRIVAAMGQKTTASHNEVMLMAGSLGISPLVCLLNNGNHGQTETQADMLGPFWRDDQPACASGDSLVRSPTPGPELLVRVSLEDTSGKPVAGAEVDVWHSSPEGLYENQDPKQAEMNLRGRLSPMRLENFISAASSRPAIRFRSMVPSANWCAPRAATTFAPHICTSWSSIRIQDADFASLLAGRSHIDSDVQFSVTRALIGDYIRHDESSDEFGFAVPWYSLDQRFVLEAGEATRPLAPIRAKVSSADGR